MPSESCPLLRDQNIEACTPPATPVPKGQLAALCSVRLVEPIAFTQLFPYVNEFMNHIHVTDDPSHVGLYSGLVESAFAVTQLISIYQWARLSDFVGRRPVVLVGILGTAISTLMLGLSKSLAPVLIFRSIWLAAGNIAVIHSVLGEITDSSNQAVAFPIYGLMFPVGSIIGPLIGGSFSRPADKYPQFFDYKLWKEFPYFLPCLIAAVIALIGVTLGLAFLEESLPTKRKHNGDKHPTVPDGDLSPGMTPDGPMDLRQLLSLPIIRALAMSGFALGFNATAFDVVFVLFCYSPVHSGGLAFSPSKIGYSMATSGAMLAVIQCSTMSYLLRTFDCAKLYNSCMGLWPIAYIALPILNVIARHGIDEATGQLDAYTTAALWVGIAIILAVSRVAFLAYSLSMILVKENAPSPASLGQSNGIVQFTMCLARALAPFLVSSLFALSIENNLLGGYFWVVIMTFVSYSGTTISRKISLYSKRTVS